MKTVLEVTDLEYYYGKIHAIKGISFDVKEGEIVTIIGANGAGKTTSLRSVGGLLSEKNKRGTILFYDKPIQRMSANKIAALGMAQILEGRHIFPRLTVEENLYMGAYLRKDKKAVHDDLAVIYKQFPRLEERKKQHGGTLSGGEQQMLAIARALINKPKMILLDEPSLGLAPIIVTEIFKIIKEISERQGISILLVEQNSNMALHIAHRGYVMQTGKIIIHDTSGSLSKNPEVKKSYLGG